MPTGQLLTPEVWARRHRGIVGLLWLHVAAIAAFASAAAVLGLITSSAVIVHLSGGVVEAHFHFFVMVGVITLDQDWLPFGLASGTWSSTTACSGC